MIASADDFFYTSHRERVPMRGAKIVITAPSGGRCLFNGRTARMIVRCLAEGAASLRLFERLYLSPTFVVLAAADVVIALVAGQQ
jgi:hypothetical protein